MVSKIFCVLILVVLALLLGVLAETKTVFSICLAMLAFTSSLFRSIPYLVNLEDLRTTIKAIKHIRDVRDLNVSSPIFRLTLFIGFPFILLATLLLSELGLFLPEDSNLSLQEGPNWWVNSAFGIIAIMVESGLFFYIIRWIHYANDDSSFNTLKDKIKGRYVVASLVILTSVLFLGIYGFVKHGV